jgi:general stress protein YciG
LFLIRGLIPGAVRSAGLQRKPNNSKGTERRYRAIVFDRILPNERPRRFHKTTTTKATVDRCTTVANKENRMANEQRGGSGNFANDPQRASEAGKKGGERSHGGQQQQGGSSQDQQSGNPGNFANDREKASEAGRKGGQS